MVAEAALIASLGGLAYVYVGYPLAVSALGRLRPKPVKKAAFEPSVTILIAAYNEADCIEATIDNKVAQSYPRDRMEVLVMSDGSTDGTDDLVRRYAGRGVRLLRMEPRGGKTFALNRGASEANGEILLFSDANSIWASDAVHRLVANFADPEVGYVTGKMIYTDLVGTAVGDGCTAYMRYENALRRAESLFGSVVGVDGGVDAVRRALYQPMGADQLPDFALPLTVVERGYRVVYEPEALLREHALASERDEYRMRVRVVLRALWAMHDRRSLLNPFGKSWFAWQLWSHKVLRYAAFVMLTVAFVSNAVLAAGHPGWRLLFVAQLIAYVASAIAWIAERVGSPVAALRLPYYFTLLNVACAHAFLKYAVGRRQVLWTPRKG